MDRPLTKAASEDVVHTGSEKTTSQRKSDFRNTKAESSWAGKRSVRFKGFFLPNFPGETEPQIPSGYGNDPFTYLVGKKESGGSSDPETVPDEMIETRNRSKTDTDLTTSPVKARATRKCIDCGAKNPSIARFCNECGGGLASNATLSHASGSDMKTSMGGGLTLSGGSRKKPLTSSKASQMNISKDFGSIFAPPVAPADSFPDASDERDDTPSVLISSSDAPRPLPRPPRFDGDDELASEKTKRQSYFEAREVLQELLDLQHSDGYWELTAELSEILGIPNYQDIMSSTQEEIDQQRLATSVVLSFLKYFEKLGGGYDADVVNRANKWMMKVQRISVSLPEGTNRKSLAHSKSSRQLSPRSELAKAQDQNFNLKTSASTRSLLPGSGGSNPEKSPEMTKSPEESPGFLRSILNRTRSSREISKPAEKPAATSPKPAVARNIKSTVVEGQERQDFVGSHTVYKIQLEMEDHKWTILRRFKQFKELHFNLIQEKILPEVGIELPPSSLKTFSDPEIVQQRVQGLDEYLKKVLTNEKVTTSSSKFLDYFLAPREVGDIGYDGKEITLSSVADNHLVSIKLPTVTSQVPESKGNVAEIPRASLWERIFSPSSPENVPHYKKPHIEVTLAPKIALPATDERTMVAYEIYSTENNYLYSLEVISKRFLDPLKNSASPHCNVFSAEEQRIIFPVIEELRNFHSILLKELEERMKKWSETQVIGDLFVKYAPFFKIYSEYCKKYEPANKELMNCLKREKVTAFVQAVVKDPEINQPDLQSYLIQPVQRVPRVVLLLTDLLKRTPKNHPDHQNLNNGLKKVKETMVIVNESIRAAENAFKFWQNNTDMIQSLMEAQRRPIKEGQMNIQEVSTSTTLRTGLRTDQPTLCNCILFNDLFVLAKDSNILSKFPLNLLWIQAGSTTTSFILWTPERKLLVSNADYSKQLQWQGAVKDAIDEYNKKNKTGIRQGDYTFQGGDKYSGDWFNAMRYGKGTHTWRDGMSYSGDWAGNKREGQGTQIFSTGDKYEGYWMNDKPHGKGTYTSTTGESYSGEWKEGKKWGQGKFTNSKDTIVGEWKDDLVDGWGELTCSDGATYKGHWKNSKKNGVGTAVTKSWTYSGEWKDDRKFAGKIKYVNKNSYEGEFQDDIPHGWGTMTTPFSSHEGNFLYGFPDGPGQLKFKNGDSYNGKWQMGQRHGQGIGTTSEGVYVGNWKNDSRDGEGKMDYSNEEEYQGFWKDHRRCGRGKFTGPDGVYEGNWQNDCRDGDGTFLKSNGDKYVGQWKDNHQHGRGTLISNDGTRYEGEWKMGSKHGRGTYTDNTGKFIGNWRDGKLTGRATFINVTDNSIYEGEWEDDLRHGKGSLKFVDGRMLEQLWVKGRLHQDYYGYHGVPTLPTLTMFRL